MYGRIWLYMYDRIWPSTEREREREIYKTEKYSFSYALWFLL